MVRVCLPQFGPFRLEPTPTPPTPTLNMGVGYIYLSCEEVDKANFRTPSLT